MKPETGRAGTPYGAGPAGLWNRERSRNDMPSNAMSDFLKAGMG
jgi:hypothetical protein